MTRPRRRSALLALLAVGVCGCDEGSAVGDAGEDATTDGGPAPAPPAIDWLDRGSPVVLTPCPSGWQERTDRDPIECSPYPESGPEECPAGHAHFPGESGCRPIGSVWPAGEFADGLPTEGAVVYVRSGAPAGGDGTMDAPFAALSEVAWAALPAGTTVALAKGTYEGVLPLEAGTRVVGACVAEKILTGIDAPVLAVVSVTNAGGLAEVSNLTLRSPPQVGALVDGGRALRMTGVLIDSAVSVGAAAIRSGSLLSLEDVVIVDTAVDTRRFGYGISAQAGARVEATRVIVRRSGEIGVVAVDEGSHIVLQDVVVADGVGLPDGSYGRGITAQQGGRVEGARLYVDNNRDVGVIAGFDESEAILEDVVIRDTRPNEDGTGGRGLVVQDSARVTLSRAAISGCTDLGLFVSDPTTTLTLEHVLVRDTRTRPLDGTSGRGLSVTLGPRIEASNIALVRNHDVGIFVNNPGSEIVLTDALVDETNPEESNFDFGRGIEVQDGALVHATRVVVQRSHDLGIFVSGAGSTVRIEDTIVQDIRPLEAWGRGGMGIAAAEGGRVTGARVVVQGTSEHGVTTTSGAAAELEDVTVRDVSIAACATTTCPERTYGYGVSTWEGTLRFDRFVVEAAEVCGVFVGADVPGAVSVDISNGVVSNARVGACIQAEGYDLSRLTNGVDFVDNETNLDTTDLPIPGAIESVSGS